MTLRDGLAPPVNPLTPQSWELAGLVIVYRSGGWVGSAPQGSSVTWQLGVGDLRVVFVG